MSNATYKRAIAADIRSGLPEPLYWTQEEVSQWVGDVGFTQYKSCFERNFITGRKLIAIDASALPAMGIHDFNHIKELSRLIRELLDIPFHPTNRSLRMRDPKIAYLEMKRRTGIEMDSTTYNTFLFENKHFFPQTRRRSFSKKRSSKSK